MKGMKTLIKLQQRDLDALRRQQTQLQEQREQLTDLLTRLENELNEERKLAASRPEMTRYMEDYTQRVKKRQIGIVQEILQVDAKLGQLAEAIATSFGELKKYEITKDNHDQRVKAAEDQKEQIQLDDVGLQQFIRKREG